MIQIDFEKIFWFSDKYFVMMLIYTIRAYLIQNQISEN